MRGIFWEHLTFYVGDCLIIKSHMFVCCLFEFVYKQDEFLGLLHAESAFPQCSHSSSRILPNRDIAAAR